MTINLDRAYAETMASLKRDSQLWRYVNPRLPIPAVYQGGGPIRLILLGQDPTVKDEASREKITRVLNLKGYGALHNYLKRICLDLGIELETNVYATNYVKNFFVEPPTQIKQMDLLERASHYWLPVLHEELDQFPNIPVISLGQPLLERIVTNGASGQVRDYWGYEPKWKAQKNRNWQYLMPGQNRLNRNIFPFPHQPSLRKTFYREHLSYYLQFMKSKAFTASEM